MEFFEITTNTSSDISSSKLGLRREVLGCRDSLTTQQRIEYSLLACEHGLGFSELTSAAKSGAIIGGFYPIRSEIDPRPLMSGLSSLGCKLCLPVVIGDEIEFRLFSPDTIMEPSGFGTIGPSSGSSVDPSILLVPLSAYDIHGGRIGYGKGFYDRAIRRLRTKHDDLFLIGMGFSIQRVDLVPMDSNDCYVDAILTEEGIVRASGGGKENKK